MDLKKKKKEKKQQTPYPLPLSGPAHLPSFFFSFSYFPHRGPDSPTHLTRTAQLSSRHSCPPAAQLPLRLSKQLAGGPYPSGPSPTSSSLSPSTGRAAAGLPRLPGRPAPVCLLHRAIKARPHSPTTASHLPLPRNRRAPSPPALMAQAPPTPRHRLARLLPFFLHPI
jgi:hypothetical protein